MNQQILSRAYAAAVFDLSSFICDDDQLADEGCDSTNIEDEGDACGESESREHDSKAFCARVALIDLQGS